MVGCGDGRGLRNREGGDGREALVNEIGQRGKEIGILFVFLCFGHGMVSGVSASQVGFDFLFALFLGCPRREYVKWKGRVWHPCLETQKVRR